MLIISIFYVYQTRNYDYTKTILYQILIWNIVMINFWKNNSILFFFLFFCCISYPKVRKCLAHSDVRGMLHLGYLHIPRQHHLSEKI